MKILYFMNRAMATNHDNCLQYYECMQCNYKLPVENFDYQLHSCFASHDPEIENLYVNEMNQVYSGLKNMDENTSHSEEQNTSSLMPASAPEEKKRKKKDNLWDKYDEILINSVMHEQCLWNYALPIKERGPLKIKEAWTKVQMDLDGKKTVNIRTKSFKIVGAFGIDEIKKRWRNLRDSYKKAKKRCTSYVASGSGADAVVKNSFRFYTNMQFLDDFNEINSTISNLDDACNEYEASLLSNTDDLDDESSGCVLSTPSRADSTRRRRGGAKSSGNSTLEDAILKTLNTPAKSSSEGFFCSIEEMMSALPVAVKAELQIKILSLTLETYNAHRTDK